MILSCRTYVLLACCVAAAGCGKAATEEVETEGLDTAEHGERGYHM